MEFRRSGGGGEASHLRLGAAVRVLEGDAFREPSRAMSVERGACQRQEGEARGLFDTGGGGEKSGGSLRFAERAAVHLGRVWVRCEQLSHGEPSHESNGLGVHVGLVGVSHG